MKNVFLYSLYKQVAVFGCKAANEVRLPKYFLFYQSTENEVFLV